MLELRSDKSALVLIDLQNGIVSRPNLHRSSDSVVTLNKQLAEQFRAAGATVVLVNVGWQQDYADMAQGRVDEPAPYPKDGLPAEWTLLVDGLAKPGDLHITKHQWGAFTGTELDLQLRRRGIDTIVTSGIATNLGVESTVRHGWELNYNMIVVEDACASFSAEMHAFSCSHIFPRISQVVTAQQLSFSGR